MPTDASRSYKVYLDLGGGGQKVRRFGLPENVATNYSVLREKVCSIFGIFRKDVVLSWKDAEGDSITLSSDDELMEAVADSMSNQNQLVRINVVEISGSSSTAQPGPGPSGVQGNQQGDIHPGITCDGCEGRVQGFRYKCVTCADFDLCGACEIKGLHKEHRMMRLPKPQDAGSPWFYWREREDGPGQYSTHFGIHSKDAGGEGFSSLASFSSCGGAGGAGSGFGWGFGDGPRDRDCHRRGHGARGRGGWPGWWGQGWNRKNWSGCGQGQTLNSECASHQQQQSSQQSKQLQQQSQSQGYQQQQQSSGSCPCEEHCPWLNKEGLSCPFNTEEVEMPTPEQVAEEAKHIAEQMAQQAAQQAHHFAYHYASDHLANVMRGIWTAWTGQQRQNATHTSSSSSSSSHFYSSSSSRDGDASAEQDKSKEAGQGIDMEVAVKHNGICQQCSLGKNVAPGSQTNTSPAPANPAKEPESSAASVASGGSVNMEVQTNSGPQATNKDVEAMDVASPPPTSVPTGGEQLAGHSGSPEPEDWMLVNQESPNESPAASIARPQTPPADACVVPKSGRIDTSSRPQNSTSTGEHGSNGLQQRRRLAHQPPGDETRRH